jgi:hypothetical protein
MRIIGPNCLGIFGNAPRTESIIMYMEPVTDAENFMSAARALGCHLKPADFKACCKELQSI